MFQIDDEWFLVLGVRGGSRKTLYDTVTFTRGYNGTTRTRTGGKAILKGTPVNGAPVVHDGAGTYIMAGGGFHVCGLAGPQAPNVLIYNTNDPSLTTGFGAIDQIMINTFGSVEIGPQVVGMYAGLTMLPGSHPLVAGTAKCDNRSSRLTDIASPRMASSGANGKPGSVSGTIYAPARSRSSRTTSERDGEHRVDDRLHPDRRWRLDVRLPGRTASSASGMTLRNRGASPARRRPAPRAAPVASGFASSRSAGSLTGRKRPRGPWRGTTRNVVGTCAESSW